MSSVKLVPMQDQESFRIDYRRLEPNGEVRLSISPDKEVNSVLLLIGKDHDDGVEVSMDIAGRTDNINGLIQACSTKIIETVARAIQQGIIEVDSDKYEFAHDYVLNFAAELLGSFVRGIESACSKLPQSTNPLSSKKLITKDGKLVH